MRILIDLQGAQSASRHRGIGRYTLALAKAMARNRGEHTVMLLLNSMLPETIRPIRDAFADWLKPEDIHVWHALAPVNANDVANAARRDIAALIREEAIRQIQPDVVHITSLYDGYGDNSVHSVHQRASCPVAITFYDAIPLIQASTYLDNDPVYRFHYLACTKQAKKADLLLAISESARQEAISHLHMNADRVVNISSAVDECFHPRSYSQEQTQAMQQRLRIHKPFVMYSGATDERKNHRGLITAFGMLPLELRQQYQLVLAGGLPEDHREQLESHVRANALTLDDVIITGRISDDDMIQLYNQCTLYVFPSWHEGFGLPALEAMSCGAATIGANTTSVPEVIGWDRALFNPHQPEAIAQKLTEALTDAEFLQALKVHAIKQAAKFSWDQSARYSLSALEALSDKLKRSEEEPSIALLPAIAKIASRDESLDLPSLSQALARNEISNKPQLLVDVSELIQRDAKTGIQRVVRSILHEWLSTPPEHHEVRLVYANTESWGYRYANQFTHQFLGYAENALEPDVPIDYAQGDVFFALDMQPQVQVFQAPFYQRMRDDGVFVSFLVHDLLPISMPEFFPNGAAADHARWMKVVVHTDHVICVSRATATATQEWIDLNYSSVHPKVDWVHNGADISSSNPSRGLPIDAPETLQKFTERPTFLMVGTLEPRKAYSQVLDAADALWGEQDFNLVIVGKVGWHVEDLAARLHAHPQLNQRLFWLEGISDEYLTQVYAHASCLIAASFGEGFGLPLIEAAQRQLPLIARDIPVFREVAGNHSLYFDALKPKALEEAIATWLSLYAAGQAPLSTGMPWLTWKQSAAMLIKHIPHHEMTHFKSI